MSTGRALSAMLVGALVAASTALGASAPAHAADISPQAEQSFAQIAACASTSDNLLASIVVDSSGSLKTTDTVGARVQAIGVALDALRDLQTGSDSQLAVRASLATFANSFTPLVEWGSVTGTHGKELRRVAERTLPSAHDGGTDYRAALHGAQASLDKQARAVSGTSCKVMLWFTDGGLNVGDPAGTVAAQKEICQSGGIADSLRRDRIAVVALALFQSSGTEEVTPADRARLKALAETSGGKYTCGKSPLPDGAAGGAYLKASEADKLGTLFAQAAALIGGGSTGTSVKCPGADCVGGAFEIPFDRAAGGFQAVIGGSASAGALISPSGERVPLTATGVAQPLRDATVKVTGRGKVTIVDVERTTPITKTQTWKLQFTGDTAVLIDTYYFWRAKLQVSTPKDLVIGEKGRLRFALTDRFGTPIDGSGLRPIDLKASVDGSPIDLTARGAGIWQATVPLPESDAATALHVTASARAVSLPSGSNLGPVNLSADVPTRLSTSYPSVSPARLDLGVASGVAETKGTLRFRGSADGPTKACVGTPTVTSPDASEDFTFTAPQCVSIPAGADRSVTVGVTPKASADRNVTGTMPVTLTGAHKNVTTLAVPISFGVVRPVQEPVRWLLAALLTLLALALAVLSAEVARRISDRYVLGIDSRVASVLVAFDRNGVRRRESTPSGKLLDSEHDFESFGIDRRQRKTAFDVRGVEFRRAFPRWPLAAGQAIAFGSRDEIVLAPQGPKDLARDPAARTAQVDFPGATGFVLLVDATDVHDDATKPLRGRIVLVVDERDGVSSVLADRAAGVEHADWDRIVEKVLAAKQVRAVAPQAQQRRDEPKGTPAEPVHPPTISVPTVRGLMDWTEEVPTQTGSRPAPSKSSKSRPRPARTALDEPRDAPERDPLASPPSSSSINFLD